MTKTDSAVVTLADVSEIIDERLHDGIVFVIDVSDFFVAKSTLLQAWIGTVVILLAGHNFKGKG